MKTTLTFSSIALLAAVMAGCGGSASADAPPPAAPAPAPAPVAAPATTTTTTTHTTTTTVKPLAAAPASAVPYKASMYHVPKRGSREEAPPPAVSGNVAAGAVAEALVRRQTDELRGCYERGLVRNPQLAGGVLLTFYYMPAGQISQPTTEGSSLNDADVQACLVDTVVRIDFPTFTGQAVKVTIPMDFTAAKLPR